MTGDGIMALFGAPIAIEDAPQKAIRTAYAIHKEMAMLSERMKQKQAEALPIKMRIGIHTGPVVVGTLGNDLRLEFKAVGDTVNLDEAEGWINKAIEADRNNGTLLNLGRTYALYAELYERKGDRNKAMTALNKAIEVFKDCGSDGFLKRAEESLASIG